MDKYAGERLVELLIWSPMDRNLEYLKLKIVNFVPKSPL